MIKVPFTHFPNGDPGCEDYMIFENDGSMTSTMFGEISIKPSFKLYRTNLKRAVGSIRQNQYNELRYQLHQNKIEPYE